MGCAKIGKTAIVSLNSSFLLLSFGLLVIGLLVQYNQDILNDILNMVTKMLKDQLKTLHDTADSMAGIKIEISPDTIKEMIQALLQNVSRPIIYVSSAFIVISGSGLLGGCCKSSCFLVIYCIFLVVIILGEGAFLALFILPGTAIDAYIKTALKEGLQFNNYDANTGNSTAITTIWMAIMDKLDCCGLDNYNDFESTLWWDNKEYNMTVPIVCCKNMTVIQQPPDCTMNPSANITHIDKGCYKAMKDKIFESQLSVGIFAGVCAVIIVVELALLVSAISVVKENSDSKNKVHPSSRRDRRRR